MAENDKQFGWACLPCRHFAPNPDFDNETLSEAQAKEAATDHLRGHKARHLTDGAVIISEIKIK